MSSPPVVLITGTTSGIGRTIAGHLHEKGYTVIGTYRRLPADHPYSQLPMDITDPLSVEAGFNRLMKKYQRIDVLINNAGLGIAGPIEQTPEESIRLQLETNFLGAVRLIQTVLPVMREQGSGKILNLSSIAGLLGIPFQGFYSASKFALEGLTEALRMEVRPFGIQVANINPGDFKSRFMENRKHLSTPVPEYDQAYARTRAIFEKSEANGSDPIRIARLVERLIRQRRPLKIRYQIGRLDEVMATRARNLLGGKNFEFIMRSTFGID